MKPKQILTISMFLSLSFGAIAQNKEIGVKPLNIGDTIPETIWNIPLKIVSHHEGKKTITLNDYKGKLIILDFWATWCGNCIASMPAMHKIQQQLKKDVVLFPVTDESREKILKFIKKSAMNKQIGGFFQSIVEQQILNKVFPSHSIPHTIVIGRSGIVEAITNPELLTAESIRTVIAKSKDNYIPKKRDSLDKNLLKLSYLGVKTYGPLYYSTITGYIDGFTGIGAQIEDSVSNSQKITITGVDIVRLYSNTNLFGGLAMKVNRRILEVGNPTHYTDYMQSNGESAISNIDWQRGNTFNYEAIYPLSYTEQDIRGKMKSDIDFFFNLNTRIEKRKINCLVLTSNINGKGIINKGTPRLLVKDGVSKGRTFETDKKIGRSKTGAINYIRHCKMSDLLGQLNDNPSGFFDIMPPVLNETGIDGNTYIDIDFPDNTKDLEALKTVFKKQGLELKECEREVEMFVVTQKGLNGKFKPLTLTNYGWVPSSYNN